jgi:hypothetical protein
MVGEIHKPSTFKHKEDKVRWRRGQFAAQDRANNASFANIMSEGSQVLRTIHSAMFREAGGKGKSKADAVRVIAIETRPHP